MTKIADLFLHIRIDRILRTTHNQIGRQSQTAQLPHTRLSRLCFLFTGRPGRRHQRNVRTAKVLATHPELELPERLHKCHALDVADCAAQLDNAHLRLALPVHRLAGHLLHPVLNGVRNVRNDLHRFAEKVAGSLLAHHLAVDLAGRDVVLAVQFDVEEALVVAQIEIHLGAVVQNEYLTWGNS